MVPMPFARDAGDGGIMTIPATGGVDAPLAFDTGFSPVFSAPASGADAKFILRKMINAIGNLASANEWFRQAGGLYTFNQSWATANGGYPKGAVLDFLDGTQLYKVLSLQDDNMVDFTQVGVDGVNWIYCNTDAKVKYNEICDVPNYTWPWAEHQIDSASIYDMFCIGSFTATRAATLFVVGSCKASIINHQFDGASSGFGVIACHQTDSSGNIKNPFHAKGNLIYSRGTFYKPGVEGGEEPSYYYTNAAPVIVTPNTKYQIYVITNYVNITESTLKVVLI